MVRAWLVDPYQSQFMRHAAVVAVFVGVLAPTVGVWVVLRRVAYLGDAMSHGTLAGVAGASLVGVSITAGALLAGVVMGLLVALLGVRRNLGQDAAIGVVETLLFALGIILISRNDRAGVDLTHYLFGQIVTADRQALVVNGLLTLGALVIVGACFGDLRAVTFDPDHARQVGIPVGVLQVVVTLLISISVVVSLDTVGLLMSVAMLVTPAATARLVTRRIETMTAIAIGVGVGSALGGLTLSYHLATPPGPTIALVTVACFALAALATWPRRVLSRSADPRGEVGAHGGAGGR